MRCYALTFNIYFMSSGNLTIGLEKKEIVAKFVVF